MRWKVMKDDILINTIIADPNYIAQEKMLHPDYIFIPDGEEEKKESGKSEIPTNNELAENLHVLENETKKGFQAGLQTSMTTTDFLMKIAGLLAGDNASLSTILATEASAIVDKTKVTKRKWEVGMTTLPGDLVYDPEENYTYIFSGAKPLMHTNPLFYPGASGVYYWHIIPKMKEDIKVYPDVDGIAVSVQHGEVWWNTDATEKFEWIGENNDACIWPPVSGNEWRLLA